MARLSLQTSTKVIPQCYAYITPSIPSHIGWTKIGFTERDVQTRIEEQTHTVGVDAKLCWSMLATYITEPYGTFTDREFHAYLKKQGVQRNKGTEWFKISPKEAEKKFSEFIKNHGILGEEDSEAIIPYKLRDEQQEAVQRTIDYFATHQAGEFLWNAKPRFGKTLSAYDLCLKLKAKNILIVTNRPAIANSWYQDYETFLGTQSGYVFVSNVEGIKNKKFVCSRDEYLAKCEDNAKACIEFVSLQDLKGSIYFGGRYDKLSELSADKGVTWDILIIDEAHEGVDTYKTDIAFEHIKRKWTLHLSGTPFKALANEKFPESAIYNWTYADEQKRKREWDPSSEQENPYTNLPRLSLFTYQMSNIIRDKLNKGIELANNEIAEYAFDLNEFFLTDEKGKFVYDADVNKFLDALTRQEKFPFSTTELREELKHTFWILNRVASAKALANKLKIHPVFKDYEIILAAGDGKLDADEENEKAFNKVKKAIAQYDKTITLSVGQLTTGVTIPEWTAVLMLSNMKSPALYMQSAFRAQNPCLFTDNNAISYRKQTAYIFDFDPARTLSIYEKLANDLIPETFSDTQDIDSRKQHVRELLNFFPVYGEDEAGSMIELDAEKVLSIPRHIHAREVVERGFMSNFLFSNISGIFGAPKQIMDLIKGLQAVEEPKSRGLELDETIVNTLHLNSEGEIELPREQVIGTANNFLGAKIYADVEKNLQLAIEKLQKHEKAKTNSKKDELKSLQEQLAKPIKDVLVEHARTYYEANLNKFTQSKLENKIQLITDKAVNSVYGDYTIRKQQLIKEQQEKVQEAQATYESLDRITQIEDEYQAKIQRNYHEMLASIDTKLKSTEVINKAAETIVETVETEKLNNEKNSLEASVRDHLRGFSRTIPAFLMAYGNEKTTLANFDSLVPEDVFFEVTANPNTGKGITLADFRMLRDGGDYKDDKGESKHFLGHLFDEVVFNDAVQEFMKKRAELANYFEADSRGDIFDYIPPQRTNQIFTPKKVVKDMVDRLEKENPGCFDDPNAKFADLYMKSGLYITEIVTRLYQSKRLKELYPEPEKRLNHIFAKQVYGCAPTEIIYHICLRYILGFSDKINIQNHNIRFCDTLEYAKKGTMETEMRKLFNL